MSGYDGYSMSNNAIVAYDSGLLPASKIGKGIPAKLIEEFCVYSEWHHCSKMYNAVNYYNPTEVLAVFGIAETDEYTFKEYLRQDAVTALKNYKLNKKSPPKIYENCEIAWLEWSGTRRHPTAVEYSATADVIHDGGQFVKIQIRKDAEKYPNQKFRKKIGANGFKVEFKKRRIF